MPIQQLPKKLSQAFKLFSFEVRFYFHNHDKHSNWSSGHVKRSVGDHTEFFSAKIPKIFQSES